MHELPPFSPFFEQAEMSGVPQVRLPQSQEPKDWFGIGAMLSRGDFTSRPLSEHLLRYRMDPVSLSLKKHLMAWANNMCLREVQKAAHKGKFDEFLSLPALARSFEHVLESTEKLAINEKEMLQATQRYNQESAALLGERVFPRSYDPVKMMQRGILRQGLLKGVLEEPQNAAQFCGMFHSQEPLNEQQKAFVFSKAVNGMVHSPESTSNVSDAAQRISDIAPALLSRVNFGVHPTLSSNLVRMAMGIAGPDAAGVEKLHQSLFDDKLKRWLRT